MASSGGEGGLLCAEETPARSGSGTPTVSITLTEPEAASADDTNGSKGLDQLLLAQPAPVVAANNVLMEEGVDSHILEVENAKLREANAKISAAHEEMRRAISTLLREKEELATKAARSAQEAALLRLHVDEGEAWARQLEKQVEASTRNISALQEAHAAQLRNVERQASAPPFLEHPALSTQASAAVVCRLLEADGGGLASSEGDGAVSSSNSIGVSPSCPGMSKEDIVPSPIQQWQASSSVGPTTGNDTPFKPVFPQSRRSPLSSFSPSFLSASTVSPQASDCLPSLDESKTSPERSATGSVNVDSPRGRSLPRGLRRSSGDGVGGSTAAASGHSQRKQGGSSSPLKTFGPPGVPPVSARGPSAQKRSPDPHAARISARAGRDMGVFRMVSCGDSSRTTAPQHQSPGRKAGGTDALHSSPLSPRLMPCPVLPTTGHSTLAPLGSVAPFPGPASARSARPATTLTRAPADRASPRTRNREVRSHGSPLRMSRNESQGGNLSSWLPNGDQAAALQIPPSDFSTTSTALTNGRQNTGGASTITSASTSVGSNTVSGSTVDSLSTYGGSTSASAGSSTTGGASGLFYAPAGHQQTSAWGPTPNAQRKSQSPQSRARRPTGGKGGPVLPTSPLVTPRAHQNMQTINSASARTVTATVPATVPGPATSMTADAAPLFTPRRQQSAAKMKTLGTTMQPTSVWSPQTSLGMPSDVVRRSYSDATMLR